MAVVCNYLLEVKNRMQAQQAEEAILKIPESIVHFDMFATAGLVPERYPNEDIEGSLPYRNYFTQKPERMRAFVLGRTHAIAAGLLLMREFNSPADYLDNIVSAFKPSEEAIGLLEQALASNGPIAEISPVSYIRSSRKQILDYLDECEIKASLLDMRKLSKSSAIATTYYPDGRVEVKQAGSEDVSHPNPLIIEELIKTSLELEYGRFVRRIGLRPSQALERKILNHYGFQEVLTFPLDGSVQAIYTCLK